MARPSMLTDTTPHPAYSALSRATTGPRGLVLNVSRMAAPKSAGQLNVPGGNSVSPSMSATIAATLAGLVTVTAGSSDSRCLPGWRPNTGVIVTTRASGGIRSAAGRAGSQMTCASTLIAVWSPSGTTSTTSQRWVSTPGTGGNSNWSVHDWDGAAVGPGSYEPEPEPL